VAAVAVLADLSAPPLAVATVSVLIAVGIALALLLASLRR
jgi:hypothetical protein